VERWSAPFFRNYQISIIFKESTTTNQIWDTHRFLKAQFSTYTVLDLPVTFTVQQPEWKKQRNAIIRSAERVLVACLPPGKSIRLDWAAGDVWVLPGPIRVASFNGRKQALDWNFGSLTHLGITQVEFEAALASERI
jgi:hypothetical protein